MKKLLSLLVVCCILITGCQKSEESSSFDKYMEEGKTAVASEQYEKALKFFSLAKEEKSDDIEANALYNQSKVLDAFRQEQVALRHFSQTNGYGYDDIGRDTLCKIFAKTFGAESAIVSPLIVSGTHALTLALPKARSAIFSYLSSFS